MLRRIHNFVRSWVLGVEEQQRPVLRAVVQTLLVAERVLLFFLLLPFTIVAASWSAVRSRARSSRQAVLQRLRRDQEVIDNLQRRISELEKQREENHLGVPHHWDRTF